MAVTPGTRIGPYEVQRPLGAGGMGEVYRARDTRLNRDVAIKVLPPSFAQDAARLERFEQEARATSTLNHPNILTVHDIGVTADGSGAPFMVAELLDGEDLRSTLAGGPVGARKAIDYGVQIANGLAAAHAKGVVHRDLKPENVFVTSDERVKILDFGLAKLQPLEPVGGDVVTRGPVTDIGVVMGTVGYMAPEQVRGETADHRSDIFSFGAILYEMLTGRRAFTSDTTAETLTAILKQDPPDIGGAAVPIPPALERIVRRCLEKKPELRFQSAPDLAFALSTLQSTSSSSSGEARMTAVQPRTLPSRERVVWLAATVLLAATAMGLAASYFSHPAGEAPLAITAAIVPPANASLSAIAVSPDGRWLAFTAVTGGNMQLWLRSLHSSAARPLAGTEGATFPFWSPDSRFIGFGAGGKLKKIAVADGTAQTVCDAGLFYGGTWNRDGLIVFSMLGFGLYRVAAVGGDATQLIAFEHSNYHSPSFLPDGQHFLYALLGARKDVNGVYLSALDGSVRVRLLPEPSGALHASGHLLYVREGNLLAQPFDVARRTLSGEPIAIADQVARNPNFSRHLYSVSDTGILVYDGVLNRQSKQLAWVDRTGKTIQTTGAAGGFSTPSLSPDETRAVVDRVNLESDSRDIWLQDLGGRGGTRFTFDPNDNVNPAWSPDGSKIVWASNREGRPYRLFIKPATGVGQDQPWSMSPRLTVANSWSVDGRYVVSYEIDPTTKRDVWIRPLDGNQQPFPIVQTPANEIGGAISPDGRWLSYSSDETGSYEVYVVSFPEVRGKWQVSTSGGVGPSWRKDGQELFYYSHDGQLMAADVKTRTTFETSAPRPLFGFRSGNGLTFAAPYAAAADGRRFLVNTIVDESNGAPLTLVINWPALLLH